MVRTSPVRSAAVLRRTVALGTVLGALCVGACSGHTATRADQGRSVAEQAGLPKDVADFFALATGAGDATYTLTVTTTDATGKPVQITTTQKPPDRRVDVFNADGTIDTTIATRGQNVQCTKTGDAWQCGPLGPTPVAPAGVFDPQTLTSAIDGFKARAADYDFAVQARTVAATPATCLVTTRKPGHENDATLGASGTLCLSSQGVPLSVEVPSGSVTATSYRTDVAPNAFDPPATVPVGGSSS